MADDVFVSHTIRDQRRAPAGFTFAPTVPNVGQTVRFDAGTTTDDETLANSSFEWDFDDNGSYEADGRVMPTASPAGRQQGREPARDRLR